jgi:1,4-alpha-glucan branching enzyme
LTFVYQPLGDASRVFLVGDFNDWNPGATRMRRMKDGTFRARLDLEPGEYQYKFVVDREYLADPGAERTVADPYGGLNGVIVV